MFLCAKQSAGLELQVECRFGGGLNWQIQTAMLCHEVVIVGGKPGAHQGATLWNAYKDDIMKDEFGIAGARKLGIRVAEATLKLSR